MTAITINQNHFQESLKEDVTIDEIVQYILDQEENQKNVITGITVDGKLLSPEEEQQFATARVDHFNDIDFTLTSSLELAFEALESCQTYIDSVTARIHDMVEFYQKNESEKGHACFAEVIETMDLFVQLITRIYQTIGMFHQGLEKEQSVQQLEIHLLSVLKALIPAKEKNDIIMLCDLLEYELIDNLTQWKIKVIPELKKLQDN